MNRIKQKEFSEKISAYLNDTEGIKSVAGLCVHLNISKSRFTEMLGKGGKIGSQLEYAFTVIEKETVENSLRGKYNATISSLLLKTTFGYKEKVPEQTETSGEIKIELSDELKRYAE